LGQIPFSPPSLRQLGIVGPSSVRSGRESRISDGADVVLRRGPVAVRRCRAEFTGIESADDGQPAQGFKLRRPGRQAMAMARARAMAMACRVVSCRVVRAHREGAVAAFVPTVKPSRRRGGRVLGEPRNRVVEGMAACGGSAGRGPWAVRGRTFIAGPRKPAVQAGFRRPFRGEPSARPPRRSAGSRHGRSQPSPHDHDHEDQDQDQDKHQDKRHRLSAPGTGQTASLVAVPCPRSSSRPASASRFRRR